jgi:hypothetical protein
MLTLAKTAYESLLKALPAEHENPNLRKRTLTATQKLLKMVSNLAFGAWTNELRFVSWLPKYKRPRRFRRGPYLSDLNGL